MSEHQLDLLQLAARGPAQTLRRSSSHARRPRLHTAAGGFATTTFSLITALRTDRLGSPGTGSVLSSGTISPRRPPGQARQSLLLTHSLPTISAFPCLSASVRVGQCVLHVEADHSSRATVSHGAGPVVLRRSSRPKLAARRHQLSISTPRCFGLRQRLGRARLLWLLGLCSSGRFFDCRVRRLGLFALASQTQVDEVLPKLAGWR